MNNITQEMRFRQSLMKYSEKYGVKRTARKYNKSRSYIYFWKARWDGTVEFLSDKFKRPQHHPNEHTPDELKLIRDMQRHKPQLGKTELWHRLRFIYGYNEHSACSSADFLKRAVEWYRRHGIKVECVQTDNGPEFTTRFIQGLKDKPILFQTTAERLGIRHKLIKPYTPRHNGKVARRHREYHNKFYSCHSFYSCDDLNKLLKDYLRHTNNRPMHPLGWLSPVEFLSDYRVQNH